MKKKIGALILTGVFIAASAIPAEVFAGRGGGMSGGQGIQGGQVRQQTMEQNRVRLRDGSSHGGNQVKTGTAQKKGNTYGPGDGTGNKGVRPLDGTGYGAPSNR